MVDTQVVAGGPVRAFVAGMGDALSTWIEAAAAYKSRASNIAGGQPTMAALAIARLCYDTLLKYGLDAKRDVENHVVTPAVEKVVEANRLAFRTWLRKRRPGHRPHGRQPPVECPRVQGADARREGRLRHHNTALPGRRVDVDEKLAVVDFAIEIGLPVTFADLGLDGVTRDRLMPIGQMCAGEGSLCRNHPFRPSG